MRLDNVDFIDIMTLLRTFTYTEDGVTKTVTLFSSEQTAIVNQYFLEKFGGLKCDSILETYYKGNYTATNVADFIKTVCQTKWIHFLKIWESEYNPLWNVDGTETRIIETKYGKTETYNNGKSETTTQSVDGSTETQHGLIQTQEQTEDSTSVNENTSFEDSDFAAVTKTTDNNGTITNSNTGTDTITTNIGTISKSNTGVDSNVNSGTDTITDTFTRGGNIGLTMTTQLLSAERSFWSLMDFFDLWFVSIIDVVTIPIYEEVI